MSRKAKQAFFGASMRAGNERASLEQLDLIKAAIRELDIEIISDHQTKPGIIAEENKLQPCEVRDRELRRIKDSDLAIFEVSDPSHGVGVLISDAVQMGKPVVCLYDIKVPELEISAVVRGMERSVYTGSPFACFAYGDPRDAAIIVDEFLVVNLLR